ncbi:MAG: hypothetical protein ACE5GJ_03550 [Gemmatimonadota bacterium]
MTTHAVESVERPLALVERDFTASMPNELWVANLRSELALDALEQAIMERVSGEAETLVRHSEPGSQYCALRYTERLALAGIQPLVSSRGDSYDNALAEAVIGLYRTELTYPQGPWTRYSSQTVSGEPSGGSVLRLRRGETPSQKDTRALTTSVRPGSGRKNPVLSASA